MNFDVLREVYRIDAKRGGAIFKTTYICDKWVDPDEVPPPGYLFVVKSTSFKGLDIRKKIPIEPREDF